MKFQYRIQFHPISDVQIIPRGHVEDMRGHRSIFRGMSDLLHFFTEMRPNRHGIVREKQAVNLLRRFRSQAQFPFYT